MGSLPPEAAADWTIFGRRWGSLLVAIFVRTTGGAALACDLASETLAAARTEWDDPPQGDEGIIALVELGGQILAVAAERQSVPAVERRRHRQPGPLRLSVQDQQGVMRLAHGSLDLPPAARVAVETLERSAPAPAILRQIRGSGLIEAEALIHVAREPNDA